LSQIFFSQNFFSATLSVKTITTKTATMYVCIFIDSRTKNYSLVTFFVGQTKKEKKHITKVQ